LFSDLGLCSLLLLLGQAPAPTTGSPAPTVEEIRTAARIMLESMCREQCDVIDVRIKTKRATPIGSVTPGFDDAPQARVVPGEVDLTLLFDSKLNPEYRKFVSERIKQRMGEFGLPVLVTDQVRAFPPPPKLPEEPPPQAQPPQPPQPLIIQQPVQPQPPPPAPAAPVDLKEAFWLKLIEALPILLIFGLLSWLVLRVLKKMEDLANREIAPPLEQPEQHSLTLTPEVIEEGTRTPEKATMSLPPPSPERLTADLRLHRGSTRRIFRRLLVRGEHDTVARAVALLGDFVVEDLSHDPALRQSLLAAGNRTSDILRAPMTDDESEDVLRILQAELVADRVAHRADDVRKEFEVLLGWGPEAFAALISRLDDRLMLLLLRHAPTHLSESYLAGLAPDLRAEMVRKLLAAPSAEPEEIELLGEAIEAQKHAAIVGGYEADHIVDLLDSLPAPEQELVVSDLESTRPDFVRRNLGQLPVESALVRVPEHALSAAWAIVPFEDWIAYLRVAPEAIKQRAVAACPQRLRDGLVEELRLRVAPDLDRATLARRKIVRAALNAAPRTSNGASLELTVVEKTDPGVKLSPLKPGGESKR
jgi:hypothetical protein